MDEQKDIDIVYAKDMPKVIKLSDPRQHLRLAGVTHHSKWDTVTIVNPPIKLSDPKVETESSVQMGSHAYPTEVTGRIKFSDEIVNDLDHVGKAMRDSNWYLNDSKS